MNLFDFFKFFSLAHSEIAENGADKVLSSEEENSSVHKTYVNFPTSRKSALNVPLYAISSGRSMVEMLGVLAIIGVLSVGAISGYSKAMMKYKLNKHAESFNLLLNNALQNLSSFGDKTSSYVHHAELLHKLGLIPDGISYKNNKLYDIFGNEIAVYTTPTSDSSYKYGMRIIFADSDFNSQVCQNFVQTAKENRANLKFINRYDSAALDHLGTILGDAYCNKNNKCLKDLSLNDIRELCYTADENKIIWLYIAWD